MLKLILSALASALLDSTLSKTILRIFGKCMPYLQYESRIVCWEPEAGVIKQQLGFWRDACELNLINNVLNISEYTRKLCIV